jgi:cytochrome c oxidase subunit 2
MTNSFDSFFKHTVLNLPELASEHGREVDNLIVYLHWLMIVLFIGWSAYFIYAIWRFRKSRNPKADYVGVTSHASSYVEVAVALVEGVLLIGFAIPLWAKAVDKFPPANESFTMRITGRQFNWIARYSGSNGIFGKQDVKLASRENPMGLVAKDPRYKDSDPAGADDVVVEGSDVAVPVGTNVVVQVTSLDVIHSFKVPALRITQDAIPGLRIPLHFKATRTNTYQINCAQLCGNGHASMKGTFRILAPTEFEAWMKTKTAATGVTFE